MEGIYQGLAKDILVGYRIEGESLLTGDRRIDFKPAKLGFDIFLEPIHLGNTADNYFLVYLTELFEGRDREALNRMRQLADDRRTIQATELQGTIERQANGFAVGRREVGYSTRYFKCSCPDWKFRRRLGGCKHIAALRLLEV